MRAGFEFTFHTIAANMAVLAEGDATLSFLGAQGWEMRGIAAQRDGTILVALQRRLDEEHPLPPATELHAALNEPLTAPSATELDR